VQAGVIHQERADHDFHAERSRQDNRRQADIAQPHGPQHEDLDVSPDVPRRGIRREVIEHHVDAEYERQEVEQVRVAVEDESFDGDDRRQPKAVQEDFKQPIEEHAGGRPLFAGERETCRKQEERHAELFRIDRRCLAVVPARREMANEDERHAGRLHPVDPDEMASCHA